MSAERCSRHATSPAVRSTPRTVSSSFRLPPRVAQATEQAARGKAAWELRERVVSDLQDALSRRPAPDALIKTCQQSAAGIDDESVGLGVGFLDPELRHLGATKAYAALLGADLATLAHRELCTLARRSRNGTGVLRPSRGGRARLLPAVRAPGRRRVRDRHAARGHRRATRTRRRACSSSSSTRFPSSIQRLLDKRPPYRPVRSPGSRLAFACGRLGVRVGARRHRGRRSRSRVSARPRTRRRRDGPRARSARKRRRGRSPTPASARVTSTASPGRARSPDFDAAAFHEHFGTSHELWTSHWGGGMAWAATAPYLAARGDPRGQGAPRLERVPGGVGDATRGDDRRARRGARRADAEAEPRGAVRLVSRSPCTSRRSCAGTCSSSERPKRSSVRSRLRAGVTRISTPTR